MKKPKPLVGTWYAIKDAEFVNRFWSEETLGWGAFAGCSLFSSRGDACAFAKPLAPPTVIVPVRCRPLTSKRRNAKRTR